MALKLRCLTADYGIVTPLFHRIDRYWDWRLSAQLRIASLASAWLLVLLMPVLGWLMLPLTVARSAGSFAQTGLNVRLGRHIPVGRPDRWDWALIASIFALAYVGAGVSYVTGASRYSMPLVLPLLLPFTALQLRMVQRSLTAHRVVEVRAEAIVRLDDYRRGELREVGRAA
ncbi:MAG TPA: hypothetical protein VFY90_02940 [Tepidiformaceae bacterium]|nr:hypothetical protein [Tepidiformaceae bacterium]